MSEWKECRLGDIAEPIKDVYFPTGDDSLLYIGLEHIEQETLRLNAIGVSTDVSSNKFRFNENDILFGKLRPYFRKVVKPKSAEYVLQIFGCLERKKDFVIIFYFIF